MRTIGNLPIPKKVGSEFPFNATIQNETATEQGTPVIEQIYGDLLMNFYKLMSLCGVTPSETQDNNLTQFQIIDALKLFSNELNDLNQLIKVDGLDLGVSFDFDLLPEDYIFIGKLAEDILASNNYTINGLGSNSYSINSNVDINALQTVLITLKASGSTITLIDGLNSVNDNLINVSFERPLSFNNSNKMYYYFSGKIITDEPRAYNIQNTIQVYGSNLDLSVVDIIVHKNKLICLCFDSSATTYRIFCFQTTNLSVVESEVFIPSSSSTNYEPYMFSDANHVYFTNSSSTLNISSADNEIGKFLFDETTFEFIPISDFELQDDFEKTTNTVISGSSDYFYTFVSGNLWKYEVSTATREFLGAFNTIDGRIFKFNSKTYYTNGSVATKWNL
jgi:hypothetical protein